jgi:DNA-binding CsgD family transcriptional regulator
MGAQNKPGREKMSEDLKSPQDRAAQEGTANDALHMLQLAARLHTAHADPDAWRSVVQVFQARAQRPCSLELTPDTPLRTPADLAALAGRMTHCASYGGACSDGESTQRPYCGVFAVLMHTAADAARKSLQAGLFEHLPPTWVVDREGFVLDCNASAKELARTGERVNVVGQRLELVGPGGARALIKALGKVSHPTRLPWKDHEGKAVSYLLRTLPESLHIAITALLDAPDPSERAALLAQQLGLTPRQSELAAHLLADKTLAGAARALGISRHTANEHLAALQQRTGAADRKDLMVLLRRIAQR